MALRDMKYYVSRLYRDFNKIVDGEQSLMQNHSSTQVRLISLYAKLLMETTVIGVETKTYLQYPIYSIADVAEHLKLNVNTVKSKIGYDTKSIRKKFGEHLDIILDPSTTLDKLVELETDITTALMKNRQTVTTLSDYLVNRLPSGTYLSEVPNDRFDKLITNVYKLTTKYSNIVKSMMTDNEIGYLNYLYAGIGLTPIDKERREKLMKVIV